MTVAPLTARELIASFGVPAGRQRKCSCCGLFTLYIVAWPDRSVLLLCGKCDTAAGTR